MKYAIKVRVGRGDSWRWQTGGGIFGPREVRDVCSLEDACRHVREWLHAGVNAVKIVQVKQ